MHRLLIVVANIPWLIILAGLLRIIAGFVAEAGYHYAGAGIAGAAALAVGACLLKYLDGSGAFEQVDIEARRHRG